MWVCAPVLACPQKAEEVNLPRAGVTDSGETWNMGAGNQAYPLQQDTSGLMSCYLLPSSGYETEPFTLSKDNSPTGKSVYSRFIQ